MRVAPSDSQIGVDHMKWNDGKKDTRLIDICQSIQSLIDLWIDEDAFERGPDVEIDVEPDHPFDAVDSDHPCEVDGSLDDWVLSCYRHGGYCVRCGNEPECCVC